MADIVTGVTFAVGGSLEWSIVVKATLVVGLALVAARLTQRTRASVRHVVFASTFAILLVLPIAAALLPPVTIAIPTAHLSAVTVSASAGSDDGVEYVGGTLTARPPNPVKHRRVSISTWLRAGWAVGVAMFLIPVTTTLWRLRRVRRFGLPWREGEQLARRLGIDAGIHRSVGVLIHDDVQTPLTCGSIRPAIVLPADSRAWSEADLQHALVHELEHVHRADWPVHLIARVACAPYWFHPLVWMAWHQLCLESERACDDAVLRSADRTAYAEQLVTLARRLLNDRMQPGLSMANRSDLSARVSAVLDRDRPRGRAGRVQTAGIVATALVVAATISPLAAIGHAGGNFTVWMNHAADVTSRPDAPVLRGQVAPSGGGSDAAFEVASIKPNTSGDLRVTMSQQPGGRFVATNAPLRGIIENAYKIQDAELIGGPNWVNAERFDIIAKAAGNATRDEMRSMLRALLTERFKLTVHRETRELPLYALVIARRDRKTGPQLRQSEADCEDATTPLLGLDFPGPRDPTASCGFLGPGLGGSSATFRGVTMNAFSRFLVGTVHRPVIDRTGLAGYFDMDLAMTSELGPPPPPPGQPDRFDRQSLPSIFAVLQEQLGLKLASTKGPVEVLVIEHVEHPTPN